jgi:hypothetical protein
MTNHGRRGISGPLQLLDPSSPLSVQQADGISCSNWQPPVEGTAAWRMLIL